MKATNTGTSSQPPRAHQGDSNLKGAAKMKLTMQIEKAKQGLTNRIRNHTPAKLLGALVLGATLVTVSATILVAGQPEASDQPSQMALGEEWSPGHRRADRATSQPAESSFGYPAFSGGTGQPIDHRTRQLEPGRRVLPPRHRQEQRCGSPDDVNHRGQRFRLGRGVFPPSHRREQRRGS